MAPWTKKNLDEIEDMAGARGMGEYLEGRFARGELELEQTGVSFQRIKPGKRLPFGHTHSVQEELYVVVGGTGTMNVEGELVPLGARLDAVRVGPGVWRSVEAGAEGLELLAYGGPVTPEQDADMEMGWWPTAP